MLDHMQKRTGFSGRNPKSQNPKSKKLSKPKLPRSKVLRDRRIFWELELWSSFPVHAGTDQQQFFGFAIEHARFVGQLRLRGRDHSKKEPGFLRMIAASEPQLADEAR